MKTIRWGILGAGDVAEVKSGPAFREAPGSELVAVMRRDAAKAADFARRHGVGRWYDDSEELISDPVIDAIYVATPPSSHVDYVVRALGAGKFVYVEKPMATDSGGCDAMIAADREAGGDRLVVAHYRRALPLFEAVGEILREGGIGSVRSVSVHLAQRPAVATASNWRLDPAVSGGGLFHDLAPHQLDLLLGYFGSPARVTGLSVGPEPSTLISGEYLTERGVLVRGLWDFFARESRDECRIEGKTGSLVFPFFSQPTLTINRSDEEEIREFTHPKTVQRPLIERVNRFFRGEGPNPSPPEDARTGLLLIEALLGRSGPEKRSASSWVS